MTSRANELASLAIKDEPAALGWIAAISPDRPIPCPKWKCRSATSLDAMRASLSPTPQLSVQQEKRN